MSNVVTDFGARNDGQSDCTRALQHAVANHDGTLIFPRGDYRITRPLQVQLSRVGRVHITGQGGIARLVMDGPGPAIQLIGTHRGTALPASFENQVWEKERMPVISGIEIIGRHAEADGIRVEGVMQPSFHHVLIRQCRHGIYLTNRARNVVISNCHIYNNSGVGIFLDRLNLHQAIIEGNHISYNKQGGLKITSSEIRNIQIAGNDIEYNYDLEAETSADVLFDCRQGTVREGTIVGNTIQAVLSPGGANIRLVGGRDNPNAVGLLAITGNLLGSQRTVIDLKAARGVTVTGNSIYSGFHHALVANDCEHLVISGNTIDHNPEYRGNSTDQLLLRRCRNVNVSGLLIQHTFDAEIAVNASLEVLECNAVNITGCQIINARRLGINVANSQLVRIANCTIRGKPMDATYQGAVRIDAQSRNIQVTDNMMDRGSSGAFTIPENAGQASGNMEI